MFPLTWGPYFGSSLTPYPKLMAEWSAISDRHPGWTLTEVQSLSFRERTNWLTLVKEGY
jgi:hypothetical protein